MTALFDWLGGAAGPWIPFAIDVALKSALILLAAFGVTQALGSASASLRHHVWTLAFAAVLALPALALTLPSWRVAVPGWETSPAAPAPAATGIPVASDDGLAARDATGGMIAGRGRTAPIDGDRVTVSGPVESVIQSPAPGAQRDGLELPLGSIGRVALGIWLAGALLFLSRLMVGVVSAWWTSRVATPIDDPEWRETIGELKDQLGIVGEIRVLRSAWVGTPMAWGLLRPALLLPDEALGWSADRRRAVALHELAHVKRRDCLVHLLAQATRAVHWVNPLAWIGAKRIRAERERACDDLVLTSGTRSADYARLLLDVARSRGDRRLAWAAVSMARPSELEGRLLAILDPARDRRGLGRTGALAASFAVVGTVLPLAAFQVIPTSSRGPDAPEPTPALAEAPAPVTETRDPSPAPRPAAAGRSETGAWVPVTPRLPLELEGAGSDLSNVATRAAARALDDLLAPRSAASDTTEERYVALMARALRNERAQLRAQAAHTLGTMESPLAVEALSSAIEDESVEVRSQVAWALGMIESADAVPALSAALRDESAEVRSQAAWALGMIESADGVPALAGAIRDESAGVRSQAAWALGMIESSDGVAPLLVALEDESESVRSQAAWGLGMIESPDAVAGLIAALRRDASAEVRSQAAWALGMIEDRSAAEALVDALEDESEEVARQAMWALGNVIG